MAITLWSASITIVRSITEQLGPVTGAALVYSISGVLGLVFVLRSARQRRKIMGLPRKYLFGCGLLFMIYMLCLYLAVGMAQNRSQAVEVGLINYLWPALTLVFSVPITGTRARWLLMPGTALALFGVFFVLTGGSSDHWLYTIVGDLSGNPAPYLLAAIAAVAWALYSNLTRKWVGDGRAAGGAVAFFLAATALMMCALGSLTDEPRAFNVQVLVEGCILGTTTFAGYSLWDNAMRQGNAILVAACSYLIPLLSTVIFCITLGVSPAHTLWIGCGLIISGSFLSWLSIEI